MTRTRLQPKVLAVCLISLGLGTSLARADEETDSLKAQKDKLQLQADIATLRATIQSQQAALVASQYSAMANLLDATNTANVAAQNAATAGSANTEALADAKKQLATAFALKDLGPITFSGTKEGTVTLEANDATKVLGFVAVRGSRAGLLLAGDLCKALPEKAGAVITADLASHVARLDNAPRTPTAIDGVSSSLKTLVNRIKGDREKGADSTKTFALAAAIPAVIELGNLLGVVSQVSGFFRQDNKFGISNSTEPTGFMAAASATCKDKVLLIEPSLLDASADQGALQQQYRKLVEDYSNANLYLAQQTDLDVKKAATAVKSKKKAAKKDSDGDTTGTKEGDATGTDQKPPTLASELSALKAGLDQVKAFLDSVNPATTDRLWTAARDTAFARVVSGKKVLVVNYAEQSLQQVKTGSFSGSTIRVSGNANVRYRLYDQGTATAAGVLTRSTPVERIDADLLDSKPEAQRWIAP